MKKVTEPRKWLYKIIYFSYVFSHPIDLAKCDIIVDMTRYIQMLYQG